MAQSGQPPQMMEPMPGAPPVTSNPQAGPQMQPSPARMPGNEAFVRITGDMRLEYEQYMQNRLNQMGMPGPRPPKMPTAPGASPLPSMANFGVILKGDNMASSYDNSSEEQTELRRLHHNLISEINDDLDENSKEYKNLIFHFGTYVPRGLIANKSSLDIFETLCTRKIITPGENYETLKKICRDNGNDIYVDTIEKYEREMEKVRSQNKYIGLQEAEKKHTESKRKFTAVETEQKESGMAQDIFKNLPNHSQQSVFGRSSEVIPPLVPGMKHQFSGSDLAADWQIPLKRQSLGSDSDPIIPSSQEDESQDEKLEEHMMTSNSLELQENPKFYRHDSKYDCLVCKEVLKEAMQTSCGHRICERCISKLFEGKSEPVMCPANEEDCEPQCRTDDTDFRLDPYDAHIFNEALKKGFGKDRFVRVNVVGNYEQGKTSLTRRLLNQSLEGVKSTDGIDVHVGKCKIKDTEWVSSSIEFDENDYLVKLAEGTSHMKYTKIETSKTYDEENKVPQNSMPSESNTDESNAKSVTDLQQSVKSEGSESISNFNTSGENTSNESKMNASFIEKFSSQLKNKIDMPLDETLTANIWDFGGQFIYYATHQIFHSRDAIYLLVFNLNKDLNEIIIDKEFPDRKSTMGCCLKFWLDSIQTYAGSEEEEDGTSENVAKPTVILVGTFKDQFEGNLEKKFDEVLNLFADNSARRHLLREQYAISNTNMSDDRVKELKGKIFELGKNHAEKTQIPLKWIPLEIALLAEKSKNIITFEEVKSLNFKNENLVEEKELKTFLKYLHFKGSLVFFDEEDLKGHIVVNPQYLVDAFRCVIGSESCIKDAKLHPLWKSLNETAILKNELLDAMWKKEVERSQKEVEESQKEVEGSQKEVEKDFHKNKEVLLMFLQRHRILCKLCIMDEAGKMIYQDKYMIPSLLKHCCEKQKLNTITCNKCATGVSLGFRIGKTALLTSLFAKITAGALGKWSPVVLDGQVLVFKNIGYFNLDMEHVGEVKLEPEKGIQLTVINQCPEVEVEGKVCDYFRRYIENLIKHEFHMFKSNTFSHYLACNHPEHTRQKKENTYDIDMVRDKERARCPNYQGHAIKCKSAIDEWFLPGKIMDLYSKKNANRRVTTKELSRIAECIGHNWRLLGVALGVRDVDIDHIEMTYPGQVPTCIYMMLCKWEQIEQDGATLLQLITCIEGKPVVKVDKDMIKNIIEGN